MNHFNNLTILNTTPILTPVHIRWSDLDPNFHLRHSVYYDFAVQARIDILRSIGITLQLMQEKNFGPILFREECVFRREIHLTDEIVIHTRVQKSRQDFSRWTFRHEFIRADGTFCAAVTVDGAWMDTKLRKLTAITEITTEMVADIPRTEDFEWV